MDFKKNEHLRKDKYLIYKDLSLKLDFSLLFRLM